MSWNVRIGDLAKKDLDHFRAYNRKLYLLCFRMTESVALDPFAGPGKPSNAHRIGKTVWYRRVDLQHRMVYEIIDGHVFVASYRIHFE